MAGNRIEYIEFFLAAARIGCPLVVLNNTYSAAELITALKRTTPKVLCIAPEIGHRSLSDCLENIKTTVAAGELNGLVHAVVLASRQAASLSQPFIQYEDFSHLGESVQPVELLQAEELVQDEDIVNVQFTSGTTGNPKAAMLTHRNIVNNGHLVGSRMHLTSNDIVCCPPPLFHCFGLVMGFLAALTNGSSIVFPADQFDASLTHDAIVRERCTALLGVPTMLTALLSVAPTKSPKISTVRVGLAAGSMVPAPLLDRLDKEMGIGRVLIAYGMTETSPVTFMMDLGDTSEKRKKGLGTVMPHTSAKVVDAKGRLLPRGSKGELCTSGYALMKGYLANKAGTNEVMQRDKDGIMWMHTGDECTIDEQGYCEITGRIKDLIIRGGENIFPAEIEEHLLRLPSICEASVVGLSDEKYGEVVSCFLRVSKGEKRPGIEDLKSWVRERLGRHKVPAWVFWVGDEDGCVTRDYPKTGSGKHQKHLLRGIGENALKSGNEQRPLLGKARL
ncbi:4-coumarate-CoA ligase [Stagonosporopsis vannaccii]|nr:4-coumarate-CoA ligase [Stagonosporopsis vannaccii]